MITMFVLVSMLTNAIEQDMAPFGFISDGLEDDHIVDAQGDVWQVAEYGDKSYMWEFR